MWESEKHRSSEVVFDVAHMYICALYLLENLMIFADVVFVFSLSVSVNHKLSLMVIASFMLHVYRLFTF